MPDPRTGSSLWLARHGETDWSLSGKHTGSTDIPLTGHGEDEAREVGKLLSGNDFSLVLCSPMSRARRTAELAGFAAPELTDDLLEWDYGTYEGVTTEEIRKDRPGWTVFDDGCPGGESASDVGQRADRIVDRARGVDGATLAVAHGHILRVVAARWLGMPPDDGRLLALSTATVSVLGWEHETAVVDRWNCG